jgi:hypothetical protein
MFHLTPASDINISASVQFFGGFKAGAITKTIPEK